ncbi:hypothetical protein F9288_12645 [Sphingomonas sp. CL5.1]|uniref:hypothetical protein n=1 Tax=Sphingomonas sp. CL5.1 TaxID=2653203 RepID=UPI001581CA3D|nr:hypothetical protein [Sphingomonas sp. CL5.1]QKS00378.1 hypothetical protein F9288_12645 [Sphingomonas sp. CL5.1]
MTGTDMQNGRRLAAWAALMAAVLAIVNIVLTLVALGGDTALLFDPARMLALPTRMIDLYRTAMVLDSFSYYLPMLPIGAYLWARLRGDGGPAVDAAILALVIYVIMGIAGTSIQIVTLPLLAAAHGSADPVIRAGSEAAWRVTVEIAQHALWWMEGPTFAFWAIVTGAAMQTQGLRFGRFLMAMGAAYALYFITALLWPGTLAELAELVAVLPVPVWLLLLGIDLWQGRTQ